MHVYSNEVLSCTYNRSQHSLRTILTKVVCLHMAIKYKGTERRRVRKWVRNRGSIRTAVSQGWDCPPSKQTRWPLAWPPLTFRPGITFCCAEWNVMKRMKHKNEDWWKGQRRRKKMWKWQKLNDGTVCEKYGKGGSQTKWNEGDDDGATRCVGPDKILWEEIQQVMKSQGGKEKERWRLKSIGRC